MNAEGPYSKEEQDLINGTLAACIASTPLDNADDGRVDALVMKARAAVAARRQLMAKGTK